MQLTSSLIFLAALAPLSMARPGANVKRGDDWTKTPSGKPSTEGFGERNSANTGSIDTYHGNTGSPWGSNIIEVSSSDASQYKYVVEVSNVNDESSNVVFWNKFGPEGKLDGHYGNSALTFELGAGESKYVAFDENTQGGMGAFNGELPTGEWGAYSCTWGEFDFGNADNDEWSGFDVSAIQAQLSKADVQGMQICDRGQGGTCSSITKDAGEVDNAYTAGEIEIGGIGGNLQAGPVRLAFVIGYDG